jgi:hypothetical protein
MQPGVGQLQQAMHGHASAGGSGLQVRMQHLSLQQPAVVVFSPEQQAAYVSRMQQAWLQHCAQQQQQQQQP